MSIPSWARPGVKVVCIDGAGGSDVTIGRWAPQVGSVYTVRGYYVGPCWDQIYLAEYRHPKTHPDGCEIGWRASNFRPLVSNKRTEAEDVALFTHHLETSQVSA
jgi:hypothetical protein